MSDIVSLSTSLPSSLASSLASAQLWKAFTGHEPSLSVDISISNYTSDATTLASASTRGSAKSESKTLQFCTGSYCTGFGDWDGSDISGYVVYVLPHGVIYEGEMRDGMFHGEGSLLYPCGHLLQGIWRKGILSHFNFTFTDGFTFEDPWLYLKNFDRRYFIEFTEALKPPGRENLTNSQPTRQLSPGCYDLGDMEYNPKTKFTMTVGNQKLKLPLKAHLMEQVDQNVDVDLLRKKAEAKINEREEWIKRHCRKAWDEPTGYRPHLYEHWFTGRSEDRWVIESQLFRKHRLSSAFSGGDT